MTHGFLFGIGLIVALMFGPAIILNLGNILKAIFFIASVIFTIGLIIYDPALLLLVGGVVVALFIIELVKIFFKRWQEGHPSAAAKAQRELKSLILLAGIFLSFGMAILISVGIAGKIAIEMDRPDLFSIGWRIMDLLILAILWAWAGISVWGWWRWRSRDADA
jgi:hypothetical protein